jgi:hypothetical protein
MHSKLSSRNLRRGHSLKQQLPCSFCGSDHKSSIFFFFFTAVDTPFVNESNIEHIHRVPVLRRSSSGFHYTLDFISVKSVSENCLFSLFSHSHHKGSHKINFILIIHIFIQMSENITPSLPMMMTTNLKTNFGHHPVRAHSCLLKLK